MRAIQYFSIHLSLLLPNIPLGQQNISNKKRGRELQRNDSRGYFGCLVRVQIPHPALFFSNKSVQKNCEGFQQLSDFDY